MRGPLHQHWNGEIIHMSDTPNVVIKDPDTRYRISIILFIIGLLAAIAAMFFNIFPEVAQGTDIPTRAVSFVNGVIALVSSAFGLSVIVPNIPRGIK